MNDARRSDHRATTALFDAFHMANVSPFHADPQPANIWSLFNERLGTFGQDR
jgi:DNA/RNA endonuclease G (NUC1)